MSSDQSMSIVATHQSACIPLPAPRVNVNVRQATLADLPAIDRLQKMHSKQLGFFPRAQMEGYLKNDWVIVAEEVASCELLVASGKDSSAPLLATSNSQPATRRLVGYCASRDRYLKRDELGAIFQLCVDPGVQRKFVGALLLKSVFERSAYGTKLYCCWCAQDLEGASRFWEACGFVPLAFRTGSRSKGKKGTPRVHIFWQKRIREGDVSTPWWFPSQTSSGAIREDRLVLPIPSGVKWSDEMPVVLPHESPKLETRSPKEVRRTKSETSVVPQVSSSVGLGFLSFQPPPAPKAPKAKKEKAARIKQKNDPQYIAAARELRDRWLEHVNANPRMLTSSASSAAKYDVSRAIGANASTVAPALPVVSAVERASPVQSVAA